MKPRIKRAFAIVLMFTAAAWLSGCSLTDGYGFIFTPEPELKLPDDGLERKSASDRTPIESRRCYLTLDDDLKAVYDEIDSAVIQMSESFGVYADSESEFYNAFAAYELDHPEVFCLNTGGSGGSYSYSDYGGYMTVWLDYTCDYYEAYEMRQKLEDAVQTALDAAPDEATDYELERFFNDYLADICEYSDASPNRHNAYGALVEGSAVCDGYSKAFQLLCGRAGIECVSVQGYSRTFSEENGLPPDTGHVWNCVNLGGNWCYVDVTWDDSRRSAERYLYFNLTSAELEKDHIIAPLFSEEADGMNNCFVPDCDTDKYSYFVHDCATVGEDDSQAIAAFCDAMRNNRESVDILVDSSLDFDKAVEDISKGRANRWIAAANYYVGENSLSEEIPVYYYSERRVVSFELNSADPETEGNG